MREDRETASVQFDWDEPSKVIRVAIDQNKARVLGISSQELATFLNNSLSGFSVTYYRERDKQVEVVLRGAADERARMSFLKDLAIPTKSGRAVPITQIADIRYELEDGIVWRRDRLPTITVRSDVRGDAQGPDVAKRIDRELAALRAGLPLGYRVELGGAIEDSTRGQKSIVAGMPLLVDHRAHAADDPAAELLPHVHGRADGAARPHRRRARAARVRQAVRLRRDARHDRAGRHHHAQLDHPRRPDRTGHRGRVLVRGMP